MWNYVILVIDSHKYAPVKSSSWFNNMIKPAGGRDFDKNLLSLQVGIGKPRFYFKKILPQNMALIVFITN